MPGSPVIKYLEKYSVAPSPSRDYYGIKVFDDQVTLYTWRISHGPHIHPVVRVTKFSDFNQDRTLQDDIQRIFGNPMFQHIKSIVKGNGNSFLTLPKNLMKIITKYLQLIDVLNLSIVSRIANEIFNGDEVWEVLYRRQKMGLVYKDEKERAGSYGWKALFREREMHKPAKDRKLTIKRAFSLRDFPSQRSSTPTKFSSSTASIPSLKKDKVATKGNKINQKLSSRIESGEKIEAGMSFTARSGNSQIFNRYSEDSMVVNKSSNISLKLNSLVDKSTRNIKVASNDEIARDQFKKKFINGEEIDCRKLSSRICKTEERINLVEKNSVISVNRDLRPKNLIRRTSAAGDSFKAFSNRKLPINEPGKLVSPIYEKFPTPRKPALNTGKTGTSCEKVVGEIEKFYQFKNLARSNCGKKLYGIDSKLQSVETTKCKSRSLLAETTGSCNTLKPKSISIGFSRRSITKKQEKINEKTEKSKTKKQIK